jgi:predicted phage baseplate assembly protein
MKEPKLDDRTFQQIVDEVKKRITQYCPEWTDHNVSDPGIAMIELFAYMVEMLLYRLNQVPELHYIKFLEMLGFKQEEPLAARALVTFWLAQPFGKERAKTNQPVLIQAGTEVATTQTENKTSLVFTVERDSEIAFPKLRWLITKTPSGRTAVELDLENSDDQDKLAEGLDVFPSQPPAVGDELYFGFTEDISYYILRLQLTVEDLRAAGGGRQSVPYQWEAKTGPNPQFWSPCDLEEDHTENMNRSNFILFHLPLEAMKKTEINGREAYWVRVRLHERKYTKLSPRLYGVEPAAMGRAVPAVHAYVVKNEFLGISDGTPGQKFQLQNRPLLKRMPNEQLYLEEDTPANNWEEQSDFADSTENKRHYTLDNITGELRLGPALRQRDGTIRQYGKIPQAGARLFFRSYRYAGEQQRDVLKGEINTLKTSISGIKRIENRQVATGGQGVESLELLKMRVAHHLRTGQRAVTAEDFEYLATEGFSHHIGRRAIAKAKALPHKDGQNSANSAENLVQVWVLPHIVSEGTDKVRLEKNDFVDAFTADDLSDTLRQFLSERCLLTTKVEVKPAEFEWVAVHIRVKSATNTSLINQVASKLYRFLHPLQGGSTSQGWSFGQPLRREDVYHFLSSGADAIDMYQIKDISLFAADENGNAKGEPRAEITVADNKIIASGDHKVS